MTLWSCVRTVLNEKTIGNLGVKVQRREPSMRPTSTGTLSVFIIKDAYLFYNPHEDWVPVL